MNFDPGTTPTSLRSVIDNHHQHEDNIQNCEPDKHEVKPPEVTARYSRVGRRIKPNPKYFD